MQGLNFVKINEDAKLPFIDKGKIHFYCLEPVVVAPNDRILVKTGLKAEFPSEYFLYFCDDYLLSFTRGIYISKHLITSDEEINILLFNHGKNRSIFKKHDKICEAILLPSGVIN